MHVFFSELIEKQYIAYPILVMQKGTKLRQNSDKESDKHIFCKKLL
jgi:hypothetical protein